MLTVTFPSSQPPSAPPPAGPDGLPPELRSALADVAGLRCSEGVQLARRTTLRIGGPAGLWVEVRSARALGDLRRLLAPCGVPVAIFGLGSNVLVPDEGLPGLVLRLAGGLQRYRIHGDWVTAGGGMSLPLLARRMSERGLLGIEALSGFPSTVGGAVRMNAGCYGTEIADVLVTATVMDASGRSRRWNPADLDFGYRRSALQGGEGIVTRVTLRLRRGDPAAAARAIEEFAQRRRASLPTGEASAGSIFRNPPGDSAGRLIEACGLKGRRSGGARISRRHANVIVNEGDAKAGDVLDLMLLARREVRRRFEVELQPEVVLLGDLAARWRRGVETAAAMKGGLY